VSAYRRFHCNRPENKFTETDLKNIFERNRIVGGDFNAKHDDWNRGRSNANGNLLKKYTDDNDLTYLLPKT
jgi:hypothetical protein